MSREDFQNVQREFPVCQERIFSVSRGDFQYVRRGLSICPERISSMSRGDYQYVKRGFPVCSEKFSGMSRRDFLYVRRRPSICPERISSMSSEDFHQSSREEFRFVLRGFPICAERISSKSREDFQYVQRGLPVCPERISSMFRDELFTLCCFVVYSTRRFVLCIALCHFVVVFFSPFSIAITSLGEERAGLGAFRTFFRFALVWFCLFPLPLVVWEGLRFMIVALPGLFLTLFFSMSREDFQYA